ncbi:unnamed protein product [Durusdinium trenchii]|uniref:Calcium-binding protein NCS-1 n=2 Tax=Durusdinium trenchii TaxID=1381693 RepID=A0ABP0RMB1_9DINO
MYGPSEKQKGRAEPPEKDEGLVMEGTTLRSTLSSLEQSLASRSKQISHLQDQLKVCEMALEEKKLQAAESELKLAEMLSNPNKLLEILSSSGRARQQRAFYLQSERIAAHGGRRSIARHRAGEIALVHQPATLDDDGAEMFDVGTAVANPYVCDSWPFEPNVLAKRTPQESSMPTFEEETEEELKEAELGLRTPPRRGARGRPKSGAGGAGGTPKPMGYRVPVCFFSVGVEGGRAQRGEIKT